MFWNGPNIGVLSSRRLPAVFPPPAQQRGPANAATLTPMNARHDKPLKRHDVSADLTTESCDDGSRDPAFDFSGCDEQ